MSSSETISAILTLAGAGMITASLVRSVRLSGENLTGPGSRWLLAWFMMVSLLTLSVFFLVNVYLRFDHPVEVLTGSIILLSSCFIFMAVSFIRSNVHRLRQEITLKKNSEKELKMSVSHDELTGLYNRNAFLTIMTNHVKIAKRQRKGIVLMYAHIDDLQKIKNSFGYQEGDVMVVETAKLLRKTFRRSDIVARVSDDEFAVFLFSATNDQISSISESFRKKLANYNKRRQHHYKLSLSFGISNFDPEYNESINSALAQAYDLMMESRSGRTASEGESLSPIP